MMAGKTRLFKDNAMLEAILASASPAAAKKLGRKVQGFNVDHWHQERCNIVVAGNMLKFSQHEQLRQHLLDTQDLVLVEASPRDTIWGIGLGKHNSNANRPDRWRGHNLLGFCLMEVRDRLQSA